MAIFPTGPVNGNVGRNRPGSVMAKSLSSTLSPRPFVPRSSWSSPRSILDATSPSPHRISLSLPAKASSSSESIAPKLALSTDWGPGLP